MERLFSQLVVVGVGLLGGSIGKAARNSGIASRVVGLFRSPQSAQEGRESGAVDHAVFKLSDALALGPESSELPQLVVICTPVGIITQHIRDIVAYYKETPEPQRPSRCLITDVGSTKAQIVASLEKETFPPGVVYIGSHPIAGSEKSGVCAARDDLFEGKSTVLTRSSTTSLEDLTLLKRFWERLGSYCLDMPAREHDYALARTSHLPHLLSATLALFIQENEFPLTGTGFADMTRLAGGNPDLWGDILESNGDAISRAIEEFETLLSKWKPLLDKENRNQIITLLKEAKKKRDALGN